MKKVLIALVLILCLAGVAVAQDSSHVHFSRVYDPNRTAPAASANITYYGGPIIHGGVNVYVIYYGSWTTSQQSIINTWLQHLGNSPLWNINTTYYDTATPANFVSTAVNFNATTNTYIDLYSLGKTLTDAQTQSIITNAINGGHLPNDTQGVYFVLTYLDVNQNALGGSFCSLYCGYHGPSTSIIAGETLKYSFVGDPAKCPTGCDGNVAVLGDSTTPNNSIDADGAISIIFHELSESVTDPEVNLHTAWQAGTCGENGDCCNFTFGPTRKVANGSHANESIGGKAYLIQEMFELTGTGTSKVPGICKQKK